MIIQPNRPIPRATSFDSRIEPEILGELEFQRGLWSEAEVQSLRAGILRKAIKTLAHPRVAPKTRGDLLDWIDSDQIAPFSFRVCCLTEGLDPDRLREMLTARF
jgi:hypothetical protein